MRLESANLRSRYPNCLSANLPELDQGHSVAGIEDVPAIVMWMESDQTIVSIEYPQN